VVNCPCLKGIEDFRSMRRKISIICILLLALSLGGWSGALAAALSCPHANGEKSRHVMAQEDRSARDQASCCHAAMSQEAQPHCAMAQHQAMGERVSEMRAMFVADVDAGAFGEPAGACAHCLSEPEIPATFTIRQANQVRPRTDAVASCALKTLTSFAALFTPVVQSRQGSPPGVQTRKHLLISVFII
jgi:hypothetical protein